MSTEQNCLPDGIDTIQEKIEYVKSCYGIIGENGNLFDWLIYEIKKSIVSKQLEEIINEQILFLEKNSMRFHGVSNRGAGISNKEAADILMNLYEIKDILEL